MHVYESPKAYIESCESIEEKIQRIDILINGLFDYQLEFIGKSGIQEYQLDTGQSKTKIAYRSMKEITASIHVLETQKQMYINRIMGNVTVLKDRNSLIW